MRFISHVGFCLFFGVSPSIFLLASCTLPIRKRSKETVPMKSQDDELINSSSIDSLKDTYSGDSGSKYILPDLDSVPRELKF